jgi:nitronate monooxygenase
MSSTLAKDYPWTTTPLLVSAPMRLISGAPLAHAVSLAGGLGFLGAGGGTDFARLPSLLSSTSSLLSQSPIPNTPEGILPVGIGFLNWNADLGTVVEVLQGMREVPAAVWFYAPVTFGDLKSWADGVRAATGGKSKIWVQVGTVAAALEVVGVCKPDVLVVQGTDAGGHGLARSSSVVSLIPEVSDALVAKGYDRGSIPIVAAGGIMDGRGVAAALALGAQGACMGTRFLATEEAEISMGYKRAVVEARDGGTSTVRSKVYDELRGTTGWPRGYDGRGVINESYRDFERGVGMQENRRLYEEAVKQGDDGWGDGGRITTYAGTGVGLATEIVPAEQLVREIQAETTAVVSSMSGLL